MGALALPLMIASSAITAIGQYNRGQYEKKVGDLQADIAKQQGNEAAAASQRQAIETRRQGERATSRAIAVAAASGAGASDKTVQDIAGDLEAQSEFSALNQLYAGNMAKQDADVQAKAFKSGGKYARNQGILNATGTLLSAGSTLYSRFGKPAGTGTGNAYTASGYNPINLSRMKI